MNIIQKHLVIYLAILIIENQKMKYLLIKKENCLKN